MKKAHADVIRVLSVLCLMSYDIDGADFLQKKNTIQLTVSNYPTFLTFPMFVWESTLMNIHNN